MTDSQLSTTNTLEGFKSLGYFPADHASVEGGKVYANGAYWSALRFPAFPAVLPGCCLVAVVQMPFHENQVEHQIRFGLEDADGVALPLEVQGVFRAAAGLDTKYGEPGVMPFAVPLYGLTLEKPGDYSFTLDVDGKNLDRYTFHVIQVAGSVTISRPPGPTDW